MNKKKLWIIIAAAVAVVAAVIAGLLLIPKPEKGADHTGYQIVLESEFQDGTVMEFTGEKTQLPIAHVANSSGAIQSFAVEYKLINLDDQSEQLDEYATFVLKTGNYQLVYTYQQDRSINKTVSFSVKDTTSPVITFSNIPNGLFLQDITEDTVTKLPLYDIVDASIGEGVDLEQKLTFKGETDADFREYEYRALNNSYVVEAFGTFCYTLKATDAYGNSTEASCQWRVKDRDWMPSEMPGEGILADYSSEGYCNFVESGDANQYYKIGNDYADSWLAEFQGAQGVLKVDLTFNNAAGWGNNTIRLRLPKSYTREDLEGKYLAVRIYVEGGHIKDNFLFAGNNVAYREEDSTTRAFSIGVSGLEEGKWQTFYIAAETAEQIGMFPNASLNESGGSYAGGDASNALQLCFHREAGYFNDMTLYVDSVSIATFLPDTELTIQGNEATWLPVEGAVGYHIDLNGEESVIQETSLTLPGEKGYLRVTPLGNGATTLDAQTVTGVYGLDAGDSVAKFDDPLYAELFTQRLRFSTEAEHSGYRPKSLNATLISEGLQLDIGTGSWGVVTGVRFCFPKAQEKGNNTTLVMSLRLSNTDYDQIRVYDYSGLLLGNIALDPSQKDTFVDYEIDISAYRGKLEGIQLIFGPNKAFTSVNSGVTVTFRDISLKNTYFPITVDGKDLMCAGDRLLTAGYTNKDVVQFTNFYNFGVPANDTTLSFSGTVSLDGKKLQSSAVTVVGYPELGTICFKVPHEGKILTILKDSVIYYNGIAVKVGETFNAKWNGSAWEMVAEIPAEPAPEYVTLKDGSKKKVENKVVLQAGYTNSGAVQFTNVYDFGVQSNDTPLNFEGTVMLDGEILYSPVFVGYPNNTTIALKATHNNQLLTILKGAVIYRGETAVVVTETFNARWDGSRWVESSQIPAVPQTRYITLADGTTRQLMATVTLNPGYTQDNLVQFPEIYNFGAPADSTPIGFQGTVLLQGNPVTDPAFNAYYGSTTVGLEKLNHKGKVVTILEGSIIYNDTAAVQVKTTFNAVWDGAKWTAVAEIPEPEAPKEGALQLEYRYGTANVIQVNTNLPASIPCANFLVSDNGCSIDQSGNKYQQVGWIGMENVSGTIVLSFHFNNNFSANQTYFLPAGAVFGFTDGSKFTLEQDYTFAFDGDGWQIADPGEEPSEPTEPEVTEPEITEPEETQPQDTVLELTYRYGSSKLIQVNTDLPAETPCVNFLASDNGCDIDQSGNKYQQIGWIAMEKVGSTIVLTFNFNSAFSAGQDYVLPAGAVFGFTDGSKYTLDLDYTFTFDGSSWTMTTAEPEEPSEPSEPEVTEPEVTEPEVTEPAENSLSFEYRYGNNKLIQINTNLPAETPCVNFLTSDNGCDIDQSGNKYQQIGWIAMEKVGSTIVLTFNFNSAFSAGQDYFLPAGAVFGFTDGSKYTLDLDYTFTFDGSSWTMTTAEPEEPTEPSEPEVTEPEVTEPEVTEPAENSLSFEYRYGNNKLIQINTNLPAETPCVNFLASDNGCDIDQSGNKYQQIGWIAMEKVGSTIVLTFNFNNAFSAGQDYVLPAGAVFGFTDGSQYILDKNYTFTFDGTQWLMTATEPEKEKTLSFQLRYGNSKLIQVNTDLPAETPCANFLVSDNGCDIDQSGNKYQQIGWIAMEKVGDTIVLTFNFNNAFSAGQEYFLPVGAIFGFSDGNKYALDKDYTFRFDGSAWQTNP